MYLQLLVCVALACRCSQAKPLMPSQVHERDTETQTTDLSDHDYVLNFLNNRKSFIAANCNMSFNGQKVSPHICNTSTVETSTSSAESLMAEYACSIEFSISLNDYPRKRVEGAELALYKLNTSEEVSYDVYISQRLDNCNQFARVRNISSKQSGWQVFNIDTLAAQWSEDDIITLRVLVIRHNGTILPCSSVMTLFVIHMAEESIPQDLLVNTQPRPQEMNDYVPVVTVFTIIDETVPSPPPVVTTVTSPNEAVPSLPFFCKLFPNRPECQSTILNEESPTLSHTDSGSPDTNRGSCSNSQDFVLTIFNFRKQLNKANCTAPFNGQTVSELHCNRKVKTKFFCALEQVDTKQQSFVCDAQFNITTDVDEMEETNNCVAPFNGQTVSAPPCNREATKFFRAFEQEYTENQSFCDVQFNITLNTEEILLGADLVMYKLLEKESSENNITYKLLILYEKSDIFYSLVNPQKQQLSSTASGWEVFSIDDITSEWQPGNTSIVLFKLYMTKFDGGDSKILSCTDIASLFIINAPVGDSGLLQNSPLEDWEDYVPVLTTFSTRSKAKHSSPLRNMTTQCS